MCKEIIFNYIDKFVSLYNYKEINETAKTLEIIYNIKAFKTINDTNIYKVNCHKRKLHRDNHLTMLINSLFYLMLNLNHNIIEDNGRHDPKLISRIIYIIFIHRLKSKGDNEKTHKDFYNILIKFVNDLLNIKRKR